MGFSLPPSLVSTLQRPWNTEGRVIQVILASLIISGLAFAAFLVLVIGIRSTERHHGLRNPYGDGRTGALARWILGVYADPPRREKATTEREQRGEVNR